MHRGGHKQWAQGRQGRDKNGLSWKVQRRLAWERDNETCQHCNEKKSRRPDVHHIDPWMNSQSHALDNLICLCQKCHMTEEAKIQEIWGGQFLEKKPVRCSQCGKGSYKLKGLRLCNNCKPKKSKKETKGRIRYKITDDEFFKLAFPLRNEGATCEEIGALLGLTRQGVAYRFRSHKLKGEWQGK